MNLAVIGVLTGLSVRKEGGVQGEVGVQGGGIPPQWEAQNTKNPQNY